MVNPSNKRDTRDTRAFVETTNVDLPPTKQVKTGVVKIPRPDPKLFEMKHSHIYRPILDEVVSPIAVRMVTHLIEKGYVKNPVGLYYRADLTTELVSCAIAYAFLDAMGQEIKKIGITRCFNVRKGFYLKGTLLIQIFNLDFLLLDMDDFLQEHYREMMHLIITNESYPVPIRKLFEMYRYRGGEQLGTKKTIILLVIEIGLQIVFGVHVDGELLMLHLELYEKRVQETQSLSQKIYQEMSPVLDLSQPVETDLVSSYPTAYSGEEGRLETKPICMECLIERKVDMTKTDTILVPAKPGARRAIDAFSDDYTPEQLQEGYDRFVQKVSDFQDNSVNWVDTNKYLYKKRSETNVPESSSKQTLEERLDYIPRMDVWDGELVILQHCTRPKILGLHRPLSVAGDSRPNIRKSSIIRRNLILQVMKLVTCLFQGKEPSTSLGDPILAAYAFEHIRKALHYHTLFSSIGHKDALTAPHTMAFKQNAFQKTRSDDENYPIANNLRLQYPTSTDAPSDVPSIETSDDNSSSDNELLLADDLDSLWVDDEANLQTFAENLHKESQDDNTSDDDDDDDDDVDDDDDEVSNGDTKTVVLNKLIILQCLNKLSWVDDLSTVPSLVALLETWINQDSPTTKTRSYRWKAIKRQLSKSDPGPELLEAVQEALEPIRDNSGNTTARGYTNQEKDVNEDALTGMIALDKGVPFWIKNTGQDLEELTQSTICRLQAHSPHIFPSLTLGGVKSHFKDAPKQNNSNVRQTSVPTLSLTIITCTGFGDGGVRKVDSGYVLCELAQRRPPSGKPEQLTQEIEDLIDLGLGVQFWVPRDKHGVGSGKPPGHYCVNTFAASGIVNRLKTTNSPYSICKVSESSNKKKFILSANGVFALYYLTLRNAASNKA